MSGKLIVALDVPSSDAARKLVEVLSPSVKYFKVGSELFTRCGQEIVSFIHKRNGKVFLDLKFHDIPNTVSGAVRSAAALGVWMCNVHAGGGGRMMKAAADTLKNEKQRPLLIGVTVLTSMQKEDLQELGISKSPQEQVLLLAKQAQASGLNGVVCSGEEIALIRKAIGSDFVLVVPGVRPEWASRDDQRRVMTPGQAIKKGADYLVVGRPIIAHAKPLEAAHLVLQEMTG